MTTKDDEDESQQQHFVDFAPPHVEEDDENTHSEVIDDDDDAATADSLDGLVASVVDDSFGDSMYDFTLEAAAIAANRPISAPLPPLNSGSVTTAAAVASNNSKQPWEDALQGFSHLSLSNPTSPSNASRLRSFDFVSTAAHAAAPTRFTSSSPTNKSKAAANGNNVFGQYSMFSSSASPVLTPAVTPEEQLIQMQIDELQQKLRWQQQQQNSFKTQRPAPMQDWGMYSAAAPQYSPVSTLYPPTFAGFSRTTPPPLAPSSPTATSAAAIDKLLVSDAPLETMSGRFLQLAQEQNGCRYLQSRIAKEGSVGAHMVLREVFVHLVDLMTDPFANYMYQKLLDVATPEQRLAMLEQVRHSLLAASLNLHGTRSVQKHIEVASTNSKQERQRQIIAQELSQHVTRLSMDTNGNHVIQRMLQHFHSQDCEFIFRAVINDLIIVTRHRHGCCVVQRSLDAARGHSRDMLIERIEYHCLQLMQDPFANYTVQYVLEMGLGQRIVQNILGRIEPLSKQKFSSNVVEKCITAASAEQLEMIVQECALCMGNLLRDAYANFVAQKLLEVTTEHQSRRLVAAMRPHLLDLNLSCSRRVVNRVIKRFPDLLGDEVIQQVLSGGGMPPMQQHHQQPLYHPQRRHHN